MQPISVKKKQKQGTVNLTQLKTLLTKGCVHLDNRYLTIIKSQNSLESTIESSDSDERKKDDFSLSPKFSLNIRPHIPKLAKQKLDDRVNSTLKLRKDYLENQAQEDFICGVCTFVVEEPSCCNECDANYCKTCIDGLDICPKC